MKTNFIEPYDPPAKRKIDEAFANMQKENLFVFPTESNYWLGGFVSNAFSCLKSLGKTKHSNLEGPFVFCKDLPNVSEFAHLDKKEFAIAKQKWPGPFAMLLTPKESIPRKLAPKREQLFFTVPNHPVTLAFLAKMDTPLFAYRLNMPDNDTPLRLEETLEAFASQPSFAVDCGEIDSDQQLTVINVEDGAINVIKGDETLF